MTDFLRMDFVLGRDTAASPVMICARSRKLMMLMCAGADRYCMKSYVADVLLCVPSLTGCGVHVCASSWYDRSFWRTIFIRARPVSA